jgi:hypothetical protein
VLGGHIIRLRALDPTKWISEQPERAGRGLSVIRSDDAAVRDDTATRRPSHADWRARVHDNPEGQQAAAVRAKVTRSSLGEYGGRPATGTPT